MGIDKNNNGGERQKKATADNEVAFCRLLICIKLRSGYFQPLEIPEQNDCCQVKSWSGLKSRSHEWCSSNRWQPVECLCGCQSLFWSSVRCRDISERLATKAHKISPEELLEI